jgi:hypothetical protein
MTLSGWHFDPRDTPGQRTCLRRSRTAQRARILFPAGREVTTGRMVGVVYRHVPGSDSQGGYLVVDWENGTQGRISPITVRAVESC